MEDIVLGGEFTTVGQESWVLGGLLEVLVAGEGVPGDEGHHGVLGVAAVVAEDAWDLGGSLLQLLQGGVELGLVGVVHVGDEHLEALLLLGLVGLLVEVNGLSVDVVR